MRPISSVWSHFITNKIGKQRPLNLPGFEGMNYEIIASEPGAPECELTGFVPPSVAIPTSLTTNDSGVTNVVFSDIETASSSSVYFPEVIKPQVQKNINTLKTFIDSKQKLKKGNAASTLKLPADTRWKGILIMFESLLNGKESLQEAILQEGLNIDREVRQLVLDNDLFWASVGSLSTVLKPICNGIDRIESDTATLSDVRHIFYNITDSFDTLVSTPLRNRLSNDRVSKLIAIKSSLTIQNKLSELSEILDSDMN